MKVAAALCWYDEAPEMLDQCIRSLEGFVDVLVALDGPYGLWERTAPHSSRAEYEQIRASAEAAGLEVIFYPPLKGPRQVEKRSAAIQYAARAAHWVMPLDADWTFGGDPVAFRAMLSTTLADSGFVSFITPEAPEDAAEFPAWHREMAGRTMMLPLVYRSLPGIRVEQAHWLYTAIKGGERVALWESGYYPPADHFHTGLEITHHCFERDRRKVAENGRYIDQRAALMVGGQEP